MVSSFCFCLFATGKNIVILKRKNHCCFVVGFYFNLLFQVQPYRSAKFVKKFGQVPYAKFVKYFEMVRPRNPRESVKISRMELIREIYSSVYI